MGLEIGKGWGLISGGTGRFEGGCLKIKRVRESFNIQKSFGERNY